MTHAFESELSEQFVNSAYKPVEKDKEGTVRTMRKKVSVVYQDQQYKTIAWEATKVALEIEVPINDVPTSSL